MNTSPFTIEAFAKQIPVQLLSRSGKVFYSGRNAFSVQSAIYVLGINPGGDEAESIEEHTTAVLRSHADDWSAYRDESWKGAKRGTHGMAPRVLHLFSTLGLNPGSVPCSNLVFERSRREGDMGNEMASLVELCWPFHVFAIKHLRPRAILCFGKTAGNYVRDKVGANRLYAEFVEANNRRWRSQAFDGDSGMRVIVATHPSIADWNATNTDPTQFIRKALQ